MSALDCGFYWRSIGREKPAVAVALTARSADLRGGGLGCPALLELVSFGLGGVVLVPFAAALALAARAVEVLGMLGAFRAGGSFARCLGDPPTRIDQRIIGLGWVGLGWTKDSRVRFGDCHT